MTFDYSKKVEAREKGCIQKITMDETEGGGIPKTTKEDIIFVQPLTTYSIIL